MENRKSTTFNFYCFKAFESISSKLVKTFTVDIGKEFASYNEIEKKIKYRCLLCRSLFFLAKMY